MRRNLTNEEIKHGVEMIWTYFHIDHLSAREVMEKKLPFSLATYYKYIKVKKFQPKPHVAKIDDDLTPTKAIQRNKQRDELEELREENNILNRVIVKEFMTQKGYINDSGNTTPSIH